MPRVALTEQQRRDNFNSDIARRILEEMNAQRGRNNLTKAQFSQTIGISRDAWQQWNKGRLLQASLESVLNAVQRAGLEITIEVIAPHQRYSSGGEQAR